MCRIDCAAAGATRISTAFTLGIRPLHMHAGKRCSARRERLHGTVYVYERLGTKGVLTATVGSQKLDILTPIEMDFRIDEPVKIAIDGDQISVFDPKTRKTSCSA